MRVIDITYPDVNNGWGCRATLWVAGCPHHCDGCHNPETWDFNQGHKLNRRLLKHVLKLPYIDGRLTISGGDPCCKENIDDVTCLLLHLLRDNSVKNIWVYTGYRYEYLLKEYPLFMELIDVLVDGPYIKELRDVSLNFRGSSNQRIIDVKKSLCENKVVEWD